ncbi:hypothetical protein FD11_GL001086 [Ligilactobacillus pobuzihii E100301 = KCTC 13174]|uniref:Integral membrane protein n=1 Tax=Ligilactobacillus pobuzihii TaxID=449659 RepID=A0A0R2LIE3_9LACO|nr:hypothetical protein FD11_GL001086 [Ligilactobacillus pobuzihii E100301 = KCTC 13174]KRO01393.1 hypothetical protein IV66_GL000279 [Ligilactobacillus pobuzihii]
MGGLSLKEETVREKNEKAAQRQEKHQEHAEVTVRDGEFAGLTKRNEDFMFHLNKNLDNYNYDLEKKEVVLNETYRELLNKQKSGVTAAKLYGTVTEYTEKIMQGQTQKKEERSTSKTFWLMALDNGLIMFIMFCVMYALVGFFDKSKNAVNGGWVTLLGTSVIAGVGLAFFYVMMDPNKTKQSNHKVIRGIVVTLELIAIWMVAFGLIALIPVKYNQTLNPIVYIILGVIAFGARYFLNQTLHFPKMGRDVGRR